MKALVLFDSNYGNTKLVAEAIAGAFGEGTRAVSVKDAGDADLAGLGFLVVGSPIIGWRPSEGMGRFLGGLSSGRLQGVKAASFDTRVKKFYHGDAAKKISRALEAAGAQIVAPPQAFYVKDKEGPLFEGEAERAKNWGLTIKGTA